MVEDLTGGTVKTGTTYNFSGIKVMEATEGSGVLIYYFAGGKDSGKTLLAFCNKGEILCFSYDGKSMAIKEQDFNNDSRIHIHDIDSRFDKSLDNRRDSGALCLDYVMKVLYSGEKQYDYVMHDYAELLPLLGELKGRKLESIDSLQNLGPYSIVWKKRKAIMDDLLYRSKKMARKGVIFCGMAYRNDIIVDGKTIKSGMKQPKWVGDVEAQVDIAVVIDVEEEMDRNYSHHHRYAFVHTSKLQSKFKKHHYYDLDTVENAKLFMNGEGILVDRAPPEKELITEVLEKVADKDKDEEPTPLG